jgi:hypothetical protein
MLYTGLDIHKRCSVACTFDGQGRRIREGRISGNSPEAFAAYFAIARAQRSAAGSLLELGNGSRHP